MEKGEGTVFGVRPTNTTVESRRNYHLVRSTVVTTRLFVLSDFTGNPLVPRPPGF